MPPHTGTEEFGRNRRSALQPEGLGQESPGHRPGSDQGETGPSPERAKQTLGRPVVPPFQGNNTHQTSLPRALPWAVLLGPFGAGKRATGYAAEEFGDFTAWRLRRPQRFLFQFVRDTLNRSAVHPPEASLALVAETLPAQSHTRGDSTRRTPGLRSFATEEIHVLSSEHSPPAAYGRSWTRDRVNLDRDAGNSGSRKKTSFHPHPFLLSRACSGNFRGSRDACRSPGSGHVKYSGMK